MKKLAISLIALAALSTGAFAQRSDDLRSMESYMGKFKEVPLFNSQTDAAPAAIYYGTDNSWDAREQRRLSEKNEGRF